MGVPLGASDARCVVRIAAQATEFGRHERGMSVVDTEDDALLVGQLVPSERLPQILGDKARALGQSDVALEIVRRVVATIWASVALLIEVANALFEQIRHQIPVLDRLL